MIPCFICFLEMKPDHTNILSQNKVSHSFTTNSGKTPCSNGKSSAILPDLPPPLRVPLPALPTPMPTGKDQNINQKHLLSTSMLIMSSIIGAVIFVCILCAILRVNYLRQRNSRRSRNQPLFLGTQEDFLDEDQGPDIDHPIWYINTIGLQQSIIESIAVFKYKKEEGLIEGTECSVCLNEFQEDENLRLLPKCSHAFHIPCIDTWLRSHKNCPLCRAPVVSDNFNVQIDLSVPTSSDLSSIEETQMENSRINSQFISNQGEDDGASEVSNGRGEDMNCRLQIEEETNDGNSKLRLNLSVLRNHSRVQSDLVESRQSVETEMQPIRRSISMDSSSAIAIHNAVANILSSKHQDNSETQILQLKNLKSKNVLKRVSNGSLSFRRMMKSSSIGHALQKGPISMKRSFSSSGKCSSSRNSSSQDPILPL